MGSLHPKRLKRSPGTKAPLAWADGPARERGRERKPRCPFCKSDDTEVISLFGSQVMTMQCKCHACGSFFEASKY
jgi:hypothetical protein